MTSQSTIIKKVYSNRMIETISVRHVKPVNNNQESI